MGILDGLFSPSSEEKDARRAGILDFNATRETTDPFFEQNLNNGASANNTLADRLGANGAAAQQQAFDNFVNSPGYQYNFDEGQRAINNNAALGGTLKSGANLKGLQQFGQNLYANDLNNQNAQLAGLNQLGFQGAQGLSNNSQAYNNLQIGFGQAADRGNQLAAGNIAGLAGTIAGFGGGGGFGGGFGGGGGGGFGGATSGRILGALY